MTNLATQIGELEDQVADAKNRLCQCENALAFERGRNKQLEELNLRQEQKISYRDTEIALLRAAESVREPKVDPTQAQLQLPQRLPDTPAITTATPLPQLPQFLERRTDEHRGRKASA